MKKYVYKSQKGAISLFVMIAMLFFLFTILGVYLIGSKREQTQTETLKVGQTKYYPNADLNAVYQDKLASADEIIPIYTKEQLWAVGTDVTIEIDGKLYDFSRDRFEQISISK